MKQDAARAARALWDVFYEMGEMARTFQMYCKKPEYELLDACLLHARNCDEFFHKKSKWEDAILAVHYKGNVKTDFTLLNSTERNKLNKFVSHLTYERLQGEDWPTTSKNVVPKLCKSSLDFIEAIRNCGWFEVKEFLDRRKEFSEHHWAVQVLSAKSTQPISNSIAKLEKLLRDVIARDKRGCSQDNK